MFARLSARFLAASLTACGTLATVPDEKTTNKIYSGVRLDLSAWSLMHSVFLSLLDAPLSFALDTVMLPYTIPKTLAADDETTASTQKPEQ
jgi:uncharacterized protein YceK